MEVRFKGEEEGGVISSRKTAEGSYVQKDAVVIEYTTASGNIERLKAPLEGVVAFEKEAKKGTKLEKDMLIAKIEPCSHAIVIKDMCATCGRDLREKDGLAGQRCESTTANVSMIHHVPELIVSDALAKQIGSADQQNVLNSRKLVLLVDLDQTIIHTTNRPFALDPTTHTNITKYILYGSEYHTKLRPYTREFLQHMSSLYEMHIVTYGQRQYAHRIAEIIDPNRMLFGQRVLSRDELFSAQHKTRNLRALFPCGDQLIAIIDDRADVWQFSKALIQVKPYRFFKEVGDINAPKGSGKEVILPADVEEDAEHDRTLEHIERILTDVHASFYKHYDATGEIKDLKAVIGWLKAQVLRGLVVVLSGIVPLGADPKLSDLYRLCDEFGAAIAEQVTDKTTHVITVRWGTDKVRAAVKLGIPIVTPAWVYACVEKWLKADEKEFELTRDSIPPPGRPKIIPELTSIDAMKKETLQAMNSEVDEVLSESDDTDEENEDGANTSDGSQLKRKLNTDDFERDEDNSDSENRKRKKNEDIYGMDDDYGSGELEGESDDGRERGYVESGDNDDDEVRESDEETTRDLVYDEAEDEEFDDMAALIERQISGDD